MKNLTIVLTLLLVFSAPGFKLLSSDDPIAPEKVTVKKIFTEEDIKNLAGVYLGNNLKLENPAVVDVDLDGDFDILIFNDGFVEYYKNTGSLEKPFFIPENMKYDKYTSAFFLNIALPYPVFFADKNGDTSPDVFVVQDKIFNSTLQKYEYKVMYAENDLNIGTGVLITIVLVLLIIVLVIVIVR